MSAAPRRLLRAGAVRAALARAANPDRAKVLAGFFKTGPHQYGEGDVFIGITVPGQRSVAKEFRDLPLPEIGRLLHSRIHEERSAALMILVEQYRRGTDREKAARVRFYLANLRWVNNWDLVDGSAHQILGHSLLTRDRKRLLSLARSKVLWERRIAMIATFAFILAGDARPTLEMARLLLGDEHDLMHKAVGWMLREVGKRVSEDQLRAFLERHVHIMPRTALRYAIERFSPRERKAWLAR
jgi:3-methyladenine DNA glycosylase AlkD